LLDSKIESVRQPVPFQMLRYGSREARRNVDGHACLQMAVHQRLHLLIF